MRIVAVALALCSFVAAGCGGTSHRSPPRPTPRPTGDASVIRAWADTLRAGRVSAASSYFALPVIVENGSPPIRLTRRSQVRAFNASLPCGARLLKTVRRGRFTLATFRLTSRPGGDCGSGAGKKAATAFLIRGGKIVEWLRVPLHGELLPRAQPAPGSRSA